MINQQNQLANTLLVLQSNTEKTTQLLTLLQSLRQKLNKKTSQQAHQQYIQIYEKYQELRTKLKDNLQQNYYLINKSKNDSYAIVDHKSDSKYSPILLYIAQILSEISRVDVLYQYLATQVQKTQVSYFQLGILTKYCGKFKSIPKIIDK